VRLPHQNDRKTTTGERPMTLAEYKKRLADLGLAVPEADLKASVAQAQRLAEQARALKDDRDDG
jgi:hypothetical protein